MRRESLSQVAGRREVAGQRDPLGLLPEYGVIRHRQIEAQRMRDETNQAFRLTQRRKEKTRAARAASTLS
jgi:hypothetical protein